MKASRSSRALRKLGTRVAAGLFGDARVAQMRAKRRLDPSQIRAELARVPGIRIENRVDIKQPLVLISQIQRSGGTLLSQLFDGHPQCHAHPYELYIGHPDKYTWPTLDLGGTPDDWFRILFEKPVLGAFRSGYRKYSKAGDHEFEPFPFMFLPAVQKAIFDACIAATPIRTQRDVFDCYMTSYFNAWIDNQNLYSGPKKLITAFVPRMHMDPQNLDRFFEVYPDGRFISIVRDPKSWYASARRHSPEEYGDLAASMQLWRRSTEAALDAERRFGDRVRIVRFEELLGDTEGTMRSLAAYLGIELTPALLVPTFNQFRIKADSSFKVESYGVLRAPLRQYEKVLSAEEIAMIDSMAAGVG